MTRGYWQFAPIGTISDPDGTYGATLVDASARYPPDADAFCACLGGNATIDAACGYLGAAPTSVSSGGREELCRNNLVLKPADALVIHSRG